MTTRGGIKWDGEANACFGLVLRRQGYRLKILATHSYHCYHVQRRVCNEVTSLDFISRKIQACFMEDVKNLFEPTISKIVNTYEGIIYACHQS